MHAGVFFGISGNSFSLLCSNQSFISHLSRWFDSCVCAFCFTGMSMVTMLITKLAPHQLTCHLPMMRRRRRRRRKQVCSSFTPVLELFLLKFSFYVHSLTGVLKQCVSADLAPISWFQASVEGGGHWRRFACLLCVSFLGHLYHFVSTMQFRR